MGFVDEFSEAPTASSASAPGKMRLDILQAIYMLLKQLAAGRCAVENQYTRVGCRGTATAGPCRSSMR
jgi:hydrogenase maturation factor